MPENDRYVIDGSLLRCDKSPLPTPLTVLPRASLVNGRYQANVLDCVPVVNIKPFGVCALTHAPCMPVMPFWTQAHPAGRTIYPGPAAPLLAGSVCQCGLGGRISVTVLPVPGMPGPVVPARGSGGAGLQAEGAALGRQAAVHQQGLDEAAHARSAALKEEAAKVALIGLGLALAGLAFPPLEIAASVFMTGSEILLAAAVAVDVVVAIEHPTQDNWVTVGGDVVAIGTGYVVGKVVAGPIVRGVRSLLGREVGAEAGAVLPQTQQAVDQALHRAGAAADDELATEAAARQAAAQQAAARAARRQTTQVRWTSRAETRQRAQALDNDGGHSYADHGAHTTKAQQANRLRTGQAPSGRIPTYNRGPQRGQAQIPVEASKFDSHAKHVEAAQKTEVEMQANKTNPDGSLKRVVVVEVPVQNAGTSYHLDSNGNVLSQPANTAKAVYRLDPVTNTYKLVTLYPQP